MKFSTLIFVCFIAACDDGYDTESSLRYATVNQIFSPDSVAVNSAFKISAEYVKPSSCYILSSYGYTVENDSVVYFQLFLNQSSTVACDAIVINDTLSINLNFDEIGHFYLKFDSNDGFISKKIIIY